MRMNTEEKDTDIDSRLIDYSSEYQDYKDIYDSASQDRE